MHIVVVDTVELNASHLERLRRIGEVTVFKDVPDRENLEKRLTSADIAILGWSNVDATLLERAASLKLIALWSTGYDYIDVKAATSRGIVVTNVPGYASGAIAEFVIGALVVLSRQLLSAHRHVLQNQYRWRDFLGSEISGKTLGVVGTGAIGASVAQKAKALGMNVLAVTQNPSPARAASLGVDYVPLTRLLRDSDAITLHSALNEHTRGMLDLAEFSQMKRGTLFVNTARAELINQRALEGALDTGDVAGAALDVVEAMPIPGDHIFRTHPNVLLTPHCAFYTREALVTKTDICVRNVESFLANAPINVVR